MSLLSVIVSIGGVATSSYTPPPPPPSPVVTKLTGLGDSIMQGSGSTITMIAAAGGRLNVPFTVHGHSGFQVQDMVGFISSEIIPDAPSHCVLEGGVNDVAQGRTTASIINAYTSMLNQLVAADIVPVVLLILPWTAGTAASNRHIDEINTQLISLVTSYPSAFIADARSAVAQFRPGGDAGNLWDARPEYDVDGLHWNTYGEAELGRIIAEVLS